jgi:hypothetical protein
LAHYATVYQNISFWGATKTEEILVGVGVSLRQLLSVFFDPVSSGEVIL